MNQTLLDSLFLAFDSFFFRISFQVERRIKKIFVMFQRLVDLMFTTWFESYDDKSTKDINKSQLNADRVKNELTALQIGSDRVYILGN